MQQLAPDALRGFICAAMIKGECTADPKWSAPCAMCPKHSPEWLRNQAIERAAELKHAATHRCAHRSLEAIREEPCNCPVIGTLPIYSCSLLSCDCADLRRPHDPAKFCADCPHRDPVSGGR